jgi:predicted esterase
MADIASNEPGLSSALAMLDALIARVESAGIRRSHIVMLGFSQGACLTAEFAVRHPARYAGIILLTGGLIGPAGTVWNDTGDFAGTPIFLGSGDPDSHVPVTRVNETAGHFERMGARVTKRIYPGRGHFVGDAEVDAARELLDEAAAAASR